MNYDIQMDYDDYSVEMPVKTNAKRETVYTNSPQTVYELILKILDTMQHGSKNNMRRAQERELQRRSAQIII